MLRFGRFCVLPGARQLLRDGLPVAIGARAFDVLAVLIRTPGTVVTKKEIVSHVWPATIVDESNLRFQMTTLRRALGPDRDLIKTVTGRGYVFTAGAVTGQAGSDPTVYQRWAKQPPSNDDRKGRLRVVMVIDDDRALCEAFQGLLRQAGLRVEMFPSVADFLACA